jgi:hypothetical protein
MGGHPIQGSGSQYVIRNRVNERDNVEYDASVDEAKGDEKENEVEMVHCAVCYGVEMDLEVWEA